MSLVGLTAGPHRGLGLGWLRIVKNGAFIMKKKKKKKKKEKKKKKKQHGQNKCQFLHWRTFSFIIILGLFLVFDLII